MVVPAAVSQLDIVRADILPDALRYTEVKWRSGNRQPLPGRQRRRAVFQKLFGADLQRVAEHGTAAVKIKIAVIRQIAKGIPIGGRFICHRQRIPAQAIAHGGAHRAGIPLFPIRRYAREPYAVRQHFRRPYIFIKAAHAAVQMVLPVVSGEPIVFPVQREGRAADAVADASNARAEIAVVFLVFPERIIAKDCIRPRAAMMHPKRADRRAILHDLHGQRFIPDAIDADSFPVPRYTKRLLFHRDRHGIFSFHAAAPLPFLLLSAQLRLHQISFKSRFSGTSGRMPRR